MIPRARFPDPLLKLRAARRLALFKSYLSKPVVICLLIGSFALALLDARLIAAAIVALLVTAWVLADRRAKREWWAHLLDWLHFTPAPETDLPPVTPLLRSGDERTVLRAATDGRRQLVRFRSTEVHKNEQGTHRDHHDYTLVLYQGATPAIEYLSAHPHRVGALKFLGDTLRGKLLRGVEPFTVESAAVNDEYELRSSTADGIRAREIFEPTFIVWFQHSGVPFEYEAGTLVVAVPELLEHGEEVKLLLARADKIFEQIQGA